jgi:hypothetical protein
MLLHKVTANGLQLLQGQLLLLLLQCLLQGLLLLLSFHLDNASWCGLWLSCMQIVLQLLQAASKWGCGRKAKHYKLLLVLLALLRGHETAYICCCGD